MGYTKKEVGQFILDGDAQENESGSITWSVGNRYDKKPGTFLKRPPGAAPIIDSELGIELGKKRQEAIQNMPIFEQWKFRRIAAGKPSEDKNGFVYFVQTTEEPFMIKIGMSKIPFKRVVDIDHGSPIGIKLLAFIWAEDMKAVERLFHKYFSEYRRNGEWFEIEAIDVYDLLSKYWRETK